MYNICSVFSVLIISSKLNSCSSLEQRIHNLEITTADDHVIDNTELATNGITTERNADPVIANDTLSSNAFTSNPLRRHLYKNFKSTYLGNKTLADYKRAIKNSLKFTKEEPEQQLNNIKNKQEIDKNPATSLNFKKSVKGSELNNATTLLEKSSLVLTNNQNKTKQHKKKRKYGQKMKLLKKNSTSTYNSSDEHQYALGQTMNLSLDFENSMVKVKLDGNNLMDLIRSLWFSDNPEKGRGKKYEIITRVLPLFVIPFLIQSSIMPFLVTKLKLLLIKAMMVGKLAILLILFTALRNQKHMQTYEVAPAYWAGEPHRRYQVGVVSSNQAYQVDGKPSLWIN